MAVVRLLLLTWLALVVSVKAGLGVCSNTDECQSGCCSSSGSCGFGPNYCGEDVCISTCDVVAECGGMSFYTGISEFSGWYIEC